MLLNTKGVRKIHFSPHPSLKIFVLVLKSCHISKICFGAEIWKNQWGQYLFFDDQTWFINAEISPNGAIVKAKEKSRNFNCPSFGIKKWMYLGISGFTATDDVTTTCYGIYIFKSFFLRNLCFRKLHTEKINMIIIPLFSLKNIFGGGGANVRLPIF